MVDWGLESRYGPSLGEGRNSNTAETQDVDPGPKFRAVAHVINTGHPFKASSILFISLRLSHEAAAKSLRNLKTF